MEKIEQINQVGQDLIKSIHQLKNKADIFKDIRYKALVDEIKTIPAEDRSSYGKSLNELKKQLEEVILSSQNQKSESKDQIDVTAPFDSNMNKTSINLLPAENGSIHPASQEIKIITDIFNEMGFMVQESMEIDDDFHMFGSLNFPEDHPARDDFDTFVTVQKDQENKPLVAPAHTSTMQNRILSENREQLINQNKPIAYVVPGRVFRNEDVDARHEHTFYQLEGIYVSKNVTVSNLLTTLKDFISSYYQKDIKIKTQPVYFPFTEPSFEFASSCPYCQQAGCKVCSYTGWIELLGCGMIHPNVLKMAQIDPSIYNGFAFGLGILRFVMLKYNIEDIRHFHSSKLTFLRQF